MQGFSLQDIGLSQQAWSAGCSKQCQCHHIRLRCHRGQQQKSEKTKKSIGHLQPKDQQIKLLMSRVSILMLAYTAQINTSFAATMKNQLKIIEVRANSILKKHPREKSSFNTKASA